MKLRFRQGMMAAARDGERGVVIVIALFVMLALAGIAVVAAYRVNIEINRSANFRLAKEGVAMTQTATTLNLSFMANQGNSVMESARSAGLGGMSGDMGAFAGVDVLDLAAKGSFGRQLEDGMADFETTTRIIGDVDGAVAGYSAGEFTFSRVALTTRGTLYEYDLDPTHANTLCDGPNAPRVCLLGKSVRLASQSRTRAFLLVGPQTQTQSVR